VTVSPEKGYVNERKNEMSNFYPRTCILDLKVLVRVGAGVTC